MLGEIGHRVKKDARELKGVPGEEGEQNTEKKDGKK